METTKTPVEIVTELYQALDRGDRARLDELVAEDCTYSDHALFLYQPEFRGRAAVIDYWLAGRQAYRDLHIQILDIFSAGNRVVLQGTMVGTHTGELVLPGATFPPTGKEITVPVCETYTTKDRKITRGAIYYDAATWLVQEGLLSQPAPVPL